jgi:DNA-binding NtrC family response regulator
VCDFPQIAAAMGMDSKHSRMALRFADSTPPAPASSGSAPAPASQYAFLALDETGHMRRLEDIEADMIRAAISRYDGHMSEVARRLGIGRSTLYRKLKELGMDGGEAGAPEVSEPPLQAAS